MFIKQPITPMDEEYSTCESSAMVPVGSRLVYVRPGSKCAPPWWAWWCGRDRAAGASPSVRKEASVGNDFMLEGVWGLLNE